MPPNELLELHPVAVTTLSLAPGLAVASVSVGVKGEAIRLLTRNESAHLPSGRIEKAGFASFPRNQAEHPYDAFLSITNVHTTYEIEIRDLADTFPLIQLLPDGAVLIVSARCRRYPDGTHDLNARIYDSQGQPREEFLLGDGIQHVQADRKGNIWVGYFDEGVYGNYGWGGAGDAAPVGASGLVCFDAKGQKSWEYGPVPGVDVISDVYALNVFGDEAWAYYYTDFPLVRIASDRTVSVWTTETSGARSFAIGNGVVLLFGGYSPSKTACRLLRLNKDDATVDADISLLLTEGGDLSHANVIGRGNILHVFVGDLWYQFSTNSLRSL
jgi:hypothetical protein